MLAAATTSLFGGKSSSLSAYTIHSTPTSTPNTSTTNLPSTSSSSRRAPFQVGLWKVLSATHKTTGKDVSVWLFEKKIIEGIRSAQLKEVVLDTLKREAQSLSRLRHPDLLQTSEPLEESRSELTFVTEAVTGSLSSIVKDLEGNANGGSTRKISSVEVDEVEIQKGILQVSRALSFLHNQARLVHLNINPDAIIINVKGDWKLSGLTHTTALPSGATADSQKYVYPEMDNRIPPQVQWKLDYLAPEYLLDGPGGWGTGVDMYSLGCILHAVHLGGKPPFINNASVPTARTHLEHDLIQESWKSGRRWQEAAQEVRDLLPRLITRHPQSRLSLPTLQTHSYFSSLAISTLNFLDPSNFASKPREEKASFLRGLLRVLPGFSDRLKRRKILPSLLDEMKDIYLLPFLLPDVFEICKTVTQEEFTEVLPRIQPLFSMKDSAQTMLILLESIPMFLEKTTPLVFRKSVMPLIYSALGSEHSHIQERALKTIPGLCETLDYSTVQDVLLIKVAIVFTKTRLQSIKVETLTCFSAMVPILDKAILTQKLVPLLAKIQTKEPPVMMAMLAVHAAMGLKVDREAVAGQVLPQLWTMSMATLLDVDQFTQFMTVIKSLGERVEKEHAEHLRAIRQANDHTSAFAGSAYLGNQAESVTINGDMDFEALVGGKTGSGAAVPSSGAGAGESWDQSDGWLDSGDTIAPTVNTTSNGIMSPVVKSTPTLPTATDSTRTTRIHPSPANSNSRLKAKPILSSSFNSSVFPSEPPSIPSAFDGFGAMAVSLPPAQVPVQRMAMQTQLQPQWMAQPSVQRSAGPNYNISLPPQAPTAPSYQPSMPFNGTSGMGMAMNPMTASTPSGPPGWSGSASVLQPMKKEDGWKPKDMSKVDWGDFDPLK